MERAVQIVDGFGRYCTALTGQSGQAANEQPGNVVPAGSTRAIANGAVQIVVPEASIEQLRGIGQRCNGPLGLLRTLNTPAQVPAFVTQLQALLSGQVPPGCTADLVAVANAVQACHYF
jgi:hypothetical protein